MIPKVRRQRLPISMISRVPLVSAFRSSSPRFPPPDKLAPNRSPRSPLKFSPRQAATIRRVEKIAVLSFAAFVGEVVRQLTMGQGGNTLIVLGGLGIIIGAIALRLTNNLRLLAQENLGSKYPVPSLIETLLPFALGVVEFSAVVIAIILNFLPGNALIPATFFLMAATRSSKAAMDEVSNFRSKKGGQ